MNGPREIVIDQCAFEGSRLDALCKFAGCHLVLASDTLLYESASSDRRARKHLLQRYGKLIRAGASWCSMSRGYIGWEARNLTPYPRRLADPDRTRWIRDQADSLEEIADTEVVGKARQQRGVGSRVLFVDYSKELSDRISSGLPDVAASFRGLPGDKSTRFQALLKWIDTSIDMHEVAVKWQWLPSELTRDPSQFCVSPQWVTWHYLRLALTLLWEYAHLRQKGGPPSSQHAEHDDQDMEYILLLSRADGILTADKRLAELARAAFPDKDVFSSLKQVPHSYRCD
jgi:hypothetical protein